MSGIYKVFGGTSIALLAALWLSIAPAAAQDPLYTIEGIKVDITAASAAAAREEAFIKAEQDAFAALAQRLLSEAELATFVPPDADTISNMVQDFELTEERLSTVRYMGTYTFRFKDSDVQKFFSVKGTAYTDVSSRPVLVLPFYQWGSRMVLWEGDNPWLNAWSRTTTQRALVPVAVPIGDAQDVIDIADNQALTYDPASLESMLLRYDAGDALIAIATPVWPATMQNVTADSIPEEVSVMMYRSGMTGPEFITTIKVAPNPEDTLHTLYERAAQTVQKTLQQDWKSRTVATSQESVSTLQARVRIASMSEWVEMQKALNRVQGVENIRVLKLSPQEARIELTFRGNESRLRLALEQSHIMLSQPQVSFATYNPYNNPQVDPMAMPGSPLVYDLTLNKPRTMQP
ncbi:MAG: DUF2066 domain-containing protein [Alphaproteobacteria bacterium]|nr:DUF2066 domain-containing protein [Alphaproteobacteria bacterium]